MKHVNLQQNDATGCRIVGAISKELGHLGPKHQGVVLGSDFRTGEIYIAESMPNGYQVTTYTDFHHRYAPNGDIIIQPNDGQRTNRQVALEAISEINRGGDGTYDLALNNCECFVNRAMHGQSISSQFVNTALGVAMIVGLYYVLKQSK